MELLHPVGGESLVADGDLGPASAMDRPCEGFGGLRGVTEDLDEGGDDRRERRDVVIDDDDRPEIVERSAEEILKMQLLRRRGRRGANP